MTDWVAQSAIARIFRRILNMVANGIINIVDDSGPIQKVQVTLNEDQTIDDMPHAIVYGLASRPLPGANAVMVFLGGDRGAGVVIATNDQRFRMKLEANGEVAIHDDQGQHVYIARDGIRSYSPKSIQSIVDGYGSRTTSLGGGNYHIDNYVIGATVTSTDHPINPPEI